MYGVISWKSRNHIEIKNLVNHSRAFKLLHSQKDNGTKDSQSPFAESKRSLGGGL